MVDLKVGDLVTIGDDPNVYPIEKFEGPDGYSCFRLGKPLARNEALAIDHNSAEVGAKDS